MKLALLAFTDNGRKLARRLRAQPFDWVEKPENMTASAFVEEQLGSCEGFVFIGAVGIAVRVMATHVRRKDVDPAVVVLDELGRYAIPILSGHLGGANALAGELAASVGAQPVITTATDLNRVFAVDVWSQKAGCIVGEVERIKAVSAALLRGDRVGLASDFPVEGALPAGLELLQGEGGPDVGIAVTLREDMEPFAATLHLYPRAVTLGVGCRRDTDPDAFEEFLLRVLRGQGVSVKALKAVASIELKKEEACICRFCEKYGLPFLTYTAQELKSAPGAFASSAFVEKTTGVDNVCERSAVLGGGKLIMGKTTAAGMTAALAIDNWRCVF